MPGRRRPAARQAFVGLMTLLVAACNPFTLKEGTTGPDELVGTEASDQLVGLAGDDVIRGGPGDDALSGGTGDDVLVGGAGADTLSGGEGADTFVLHLGENGDVSLDELVDFKPEQGDRILILGFRPELLDTARKNVRAEDGVLHVRVNPNSDDWKPVVDTGRADLSTEVLLGPESLGFGVRARF